MKGKAVALIVSILLVVVANSQSNYFIYIENTTQKPVTVLANSNTYTAASHITIAKLPASTYLLAISLGNEKPALFNVTIKNTDLGFVLKNSADKGLYLYNFNSQEIIYATEDVSTLVEEPTKPATPVVTSKTPTTTTSTAKNTSPAAVKIIEPEKESVAVVEPVRPVVNTNAPVKIKETVTAKGVDQTYVVINKDKKDTVVIFIPTTTANKPATILPPAVTKAEPVAAVVKTIQPEKEIVIPEIQTAKLTNNNCISAATALELGDLSTALKTAATDKERLKTFNQFAVKKLCINCKQLNSLGKLIQNDYYRLELFKNAKAITNDGNNFSSLANSFTDDAVKEMFNELVNQ